MTRDCYTCRFSPPWEGPGTMADCYTLTGDEGLDAAAVDFCETSGVNDKDSDRPGWPREGNIVECPLWAARGGL